MKRFVLLFNLGIIEVPQDYEHTVQLTRFRKRHYRGEEEGPFHLYSDDITDEHFSNPSRVLKPGDRLRVCVFQLDKHRSATFTSKGAMAFLARQGMAIYLGAQGASLVFEQKHDQLPKDRWFASFDKKGRLWTTKGGMKIHCLVPCLRIHQIEGEGSFFCGCFDRKWHQSVAFLGFSEVE